MGGVLFGRTVKVMGALVTAPKALETTQLKLSPLLTAMLALLTV
jgi:hypothetical protein